MIGIKDQRVQRLIKLLVGKDLPLRSSNPLNLLHDGFYWNQWL